MNDGAGLRGCDAECEQRGGGNHPERHAERAVDDLRAEPDCRQQQIIAEHRVAPFVREIQAEPL